MLYLPLRMAGTLVGTLVFGALFVKLKYLQDEDQRPEGQGPGQAPLVNLLPARSLNLPLTFAVR